MYAVNKNISLEKRHYETSKFEICVNNDIHMEDKVRFVWCMARVTLSLIDKRAIRAT